MKIAELPGGVTVSGEMPLDSNGVPVARPSGIEQGPV